MLVCAVPRSAELNETVITVLNYTNDTINYQFNISVRMLFIEITPYVLRLLYSVLVKF